MKDLRMIFRRKRVVMPEPATTGILPPNPEETDPPPACFMDDDQGGEVLSASDAASDRSLDPALLVAEAMLSRALRQSAVTIAELQAPAAMFVVQTPSELWTKLASEAWGAFVHDGAEPRSAMRYGGYSKPTWVAFVTGRHRGVTDYDRVDADEWLADCIWREVPVTGFSSLPDEHLPIDLVKAADYRIVVEGPLPEDLAEAARLLTSDDTTVALTTQQATSATPRLLRLARRPGQSADAYLSKLESLLREAASNTSVPQPRQTPRDIPTLNKLHGMDEAVQWGMDLVADVAAFQAGNLPWSEVGGQACLLSGPPGCAKTLFARALAASCGVPLLTGSYGAWLGSGSAHQGTLIKGMRDTFAAARKAKPCILFLDEIDSFPDRASLRHDHADWEIQVVNALLAEIDGTAGREGVVLLAACNHPEKLDPALVRSGRLERHIHIGPPNRIGLEKILREHLGTDLASEPLASAALAAIGSNGADCERFVRGARRRARVAGRPMCLADLLVEIDGGHERSDDELRLAAVHEAGHALAACVLMPGKLQAVTIRATAAAT